MENKVVVITGASAGIGAALAELVGQKGGRPVLAARQGARAAPGGGARRGPKRCPSLPMSPGVRTSSASWTRRSPASGRWMSG